MDITESAGTSMTAEVYNAGRREFALRPRSRHGPGHRSPRQAVGPRPLSPGEGPGANQFGPRNEPARVGAPMSPIRNLRRLPGLTAATLLHIRMPDACQSCGAAASGYVCKHCGRPLAKMADYASERSALDEFHGLVARAPRGEACRLLRNGFLPASPEALIDSGLLVMPLVSGDYALETQTVDNHDGGTNPAEAASARLETIIAKLRIHGPDQPTRAAIDQFQAHLDRYRRNEGLYGFLGIGLVLALLAALAASGWLLFR